MYVIIFRVIWARESCGAVIWCGFHVGVRARFISLVYLTDGHRNSHPAGTQSCLSCKWCVSSGYIPQPFAARKKERNNASLSYGCLSITQGCTNDFFFFFKAGSAGWTLLSEHVKCRSVIKRCEVACCFRVMQGLGWGLSKPLNLSLALCFCSLKPLLPAAGHFCCCLTREISSVES